MDAKEKARELVNEYLQVYDGRVIQAKQCALIAVNKMTAMLPFTDINTYIGKWCERERTFLNEVKQEIEKL